MTKPNLKNEHLKRRFFHWLANADGCCPATVNNVNKSIALYEEFTRSADLATFSPEKAVRFKEWILERRHNGRPLSVATIRSYTHDLRKFFKWLAWQPGCRSRLTPDVADFLRMNEKDERMARQVMPKNYPSLDYVRNLATSIDVRTEVDQRDRALIAFTLLTGMRDHAVVTLPLGCFDESALTVRQDPKMGVRTKFSKLILSQVFRFDETLLSRVVEWAQHLKRRGFGTGEPLFPRSKANKSRESLSFGQAVEVEPVFWQGAGPMRQIFKERANAAGLPYFAPHTFRHLAVDLATRGCRNAEQFKAVSQNFGHEHVGTTLSVYGHYTPDRLSQIITGIDFSETPNQDKLDQIRKILAGG